MDSREGERDFLLTNCACTVSGLVSTCLRSLNLAEGSVGEQF